MKEEGVGSGYISGVITEETLDQYLRYVTRWERVDRPEPAAWLASLTHESAHGTRSALLWYHRETSGNVLDLPTGRPVPRLLVRPRRGLADRVGSTPDGTRHDDPAT